MSSCIRTFTGVLIDPLKPDPLLIDYIDIFHGISGEGRYTNHTSEPWTVGAHSLVVLRLVPKELAFDALMHDASEGYLRDMPRPVKHSREFASYMRIEARLQRAIAKRYGFAFPEPPEVKRWDDIVLKYEQWIFMRGHDRPDHRSLGITASEAGEIDRQINLGKSKTREQVKSMLINSFYELRTRRCFPAS